MDSATPWRRRSLRLFWGYALLLLLVGIALIASIDDANAGYPALFFAGLVLAASVPVWIVSLAFGGIALARREPGPVAPLFVVVLSVVLLLMALPSAYRVVRAILGA